MRQAISLVACKHAQVNITAIAGKVRAKNYTLWGEGRLSEGAGAPAAMTSRLHQRPALPRPAPPAPRTRRRAGPHANTRTCARPISQIPGAEPRRTRAPALRCSTQPAAAALSSISPCLRAGSCASGAKGTYFVDPAAKKGNETVQGLNKVWFKEASTNMTGNLWGK